MEIWKDIKKYKGFYQVSNFGRVRSWINNKRNKRRHPKILSTPNDGAGYPMIVINSVKYGSFTTRVHRLVAKHFIPNPEKKPEVNHIDANKENNHYTNLEWCTSKENQDHATKNGLMEFGEKRYNSKLTNKKVKEIRASYKSGSVSQTELAEKYGVSQRLIMNVLNRTAWKHVK